MSKLAAAYIRSSKDRHDVSMASQESEIRGRARADGYAISDVYNDAAISGKDDDRPEFQRMVSDAQRPQRGWSRLYVFDTARFSRDPLDAATYEKLLEKAGVRVCYLQIPDDAEESTRALTKGVFRAIDHFHSIKSKEGSIRGQKENILRGFRAGGSAPYGYQLEIKDTGVVREGKPVTKSRLVPDPSTAPIVREFFDRRSRGEGRKSIAQDLNRRGIPSPRGKKWNPTTLRAFEFNIDSYLGDTVWGRNGERSSKGFKGPRWRDRDSCTIKEGTHEALICRETAKKIILPRTQKSGPRARPSTYLLTSRLFCESCGEGYTGAKGYYQCGGRAKYGRDHCTNGTIKQDSIEAAIQSLVVQDVLQPKFRREYIRLAKRHLREQPERTADQALLRDRLAEIVRAKEKWVRAFESGANGSETAISRLQSLEAEEAEVRGRLAEIEAQNHVIAPDELADDRLLGELLDRFEQTMQYGDIYDRRDLLGMTIDRIDLGKQKPNTRERDAIAYARLPNTPLKDGVPDGI